MVSVRKGIAKKPAVAVARTFAAPTLAQAAETSTTLSSATTAPPLRRVADLHWTEVPPLALDAPFDVEGAIVYSTPRALIRAVAVFLWGHLQAAMGGPSSRHSRIYTTAPGEGGIVHR